MTSASSQRIRLNDVIINSNRSNDPTPGLGESYALEVIHPLWVESRNHRLGTSNRLTVGYRRDTAEPLRESPSL